MNASRISLRWGVSVNDEKWCSMMKVKTRLLLLSIMIITLVYQIVVIKYPACSLDYIYYKWSPHYKEEQKREKCRKISYSLEMIKRLIDEYNNDNKRLLADIDDLEALIKRKYNNSPGIQRKMTYDEFYNDIMLDPYGKKYYLDSSKREIYCVDKEIIGLCSDEAFLKNNRGLILKIKY